MNNYRKYYGHIGHCQKGLSIQGHTVKLKGKVHSLTEKDEARKAAYYAPGVYKVDNDLEVSY